MWRKVERKGAILGRTLTSKSLIPPLAYGPLLHGTVSEDLGKSSSCLPLPSSFFIWRAEPGEAAACSLFTNSETWRSLVKLVTCGKSNPCLFLLASVILCPREWPLFALTQEELRT